MSAPLEFLRKAQEDPKLSAAVFAAVEKGGMATASEVMRIAKEAGYSFTKEEFERAVRRSISKRFLAGESSLATVVSAQDTPESSCAKGCLSYTTSWHPTEELFNDPLIDPIRNRK
mgnify:CR=1 FL=1